MAFVLFDQQAKAKMQFFIKLFVHFYEAKYLRHPIFFQQYFLTKNEKIHDRSVTSSDCGTRQSNE